MDATSEPTLASINRQLEKNQWRITRCLHDPEYYEVREPIAAGQYIKAMVWRDGPNGLEPSHRESIPVPAVPEPITETDDGFILNYRDRMRFRYGFVSARS